MSVSVVSCRDVRPARLLGVVTVALVWLVLARSGDAQSGRVTGVVIDERNEPIRGATVVASNPEAAPARFTAVTDAKGRFAMLGLRRGLWMFTVSAQGFEPVSGSAPISSMNVNPPLQIRLGRAAGTVVSPLEGVDTKALQDDLLAADELLEARRYDEAAAKYQAIADRMPALTLVNLQIGRALRMKGDLDGAVAAYQKVLAADPVNETAKVEIGLVNLEKGNLEAAEAFASEAAAQEGATGEAFCALGDVKLARGQLEEASGQYQRAADADPWWSRPVYKLGLVAVKRGEHDAATAFLERAIELEPDSVEAREARALLERSKR